MKYYSNLLMLLFVVFALSAGAQNAKSLPELQLNLMNLRFGMFIHFSPTTYLDLSDQLLPDHAPPHQGKDGVLGTADDLSPALFNPVKLDCEQWADAAKRKAARDRKIVKIDCNIIDTRFVMSRRGTGWGA